MNSLSKSKWMLAAMFGIGLVTGGICTGAFLARQFPPPGMPSGAQIVERVRTDMRSEEKIAAKQEQALEPALRAFSSELDAIRQETLSRISKAVETKNAAVMTVLTPEQQTRFQESERKRLEHFRKIQEGGTTNR